MSDSMNQEAPVLQTGEEVTEGLLKHMLASTKHSDAHNLNIWNSHKNSEKTATSQNHILSEVV